MKYGHWTVIGKPEKAPSGHKRVLARCKCGVEQVVQLGNLRSGKSTRCRSCAKKGRPSNRRTHGEAMKKTVEWRAWRSMRQRCEKGYNASFDHYGGRGIKVCDRWQRSNGYANFLEDMGRRPSPRHSLDRIDVNGDYDPGNCQWATIEQQNNNKSKHVLLTINDQTKTLAQWAKIAGIKYHTAWRRHRLGWEPRAIIETPVRGHA